jgi:fumarylacetoacetase
MLDETHSPQRESWVASANGHACFPIQNLPFGVFSPVGMSPRIGVAIGDAVVDLAALADAGLFTGSIARLGPELSAASLNALMARGASVRSELRRQLGALLSVDGGSDGAPRQTVREALYAAENCTLHLPAAVGDYTDFYAGIHHATAVGKLFRPDAPLLPNYKYVPVGYHGRSSSIVVSGTAVRHPSGQVIPPDASAPSRRPSAKLDFELELAIWLGQGNERGQPVPIASAAECCWGFGLLNDWSARDMQAWEYQPLGPFLSKNFSTSVSPWVITPEALAPFRIPAWEREASDPAPLEYLKDAHDMAWGGVDIELEVTMSTALSRARGYPEFRLTTSNSKHLYWTFAQMVAHHTSNGCPLRPGDLFGTGTISGTGGAEAGSLLELTENGGVPFTLDSGETRTFLELGDELVLRGYCRKEGYTRIGLGECRGMIW